MKLIIETTENNMVLDKVIYRMALDRFPPAVDNLPLSMFTEKGQLLAARGNMDPVVVGVGSDGQVLTADPSEESGLKWKTMQLGTSELTNSESIPITVGTVVTNGITAGTIRIATSADVTNLYVAAENILAGESGVVYTVAGASCLVKVTTGAIAVGNLLAVSSTDGIAEVAGEDADYFATSVTAKDAGQVGTVMAILKGTSRSSGGGADVMSIFLFS